MGIGLFSLLATSSAIGTFSTMPWAFLALLLEDYGDIFVYTGAVFGLLINAAILYVIVTAIENRVRNGTFWRLGIYIIMLSIIALILGYMFIVWLFIGSGI